MSFTKAELKPGYLVERKDGKLKMVMPTSTGLVLTEKDGVWFSLDSYEDNLNLKTNEDWSINKVYGLTHFAQKTLKFETVDRDLLWERKEKKKMTVAEIEQELGYEVEIISEEMR